jgi:hypothetical protein
LIKLCCAPGNEKQVYWRKPVPKILSEDEVADYRDRGYHFPIDALNGSEVADFRRKLEDYEAESGGPIKGEMRHRSHVLFTWINEMVRHPKILDAMEDLLEHQLLHQGGA